MHNDNQEWTHTTMRAAMDECDSTPYKMMGFAILGGIAMAFSPVAAAALGIGGIIWCQKKEFDSCNRAEFAALYGAAGVAAKGQLLKEYVADVGREEVAKQLLCAARMNRPINQDGWNLLEDHYGDEKLDELLDEKTEAEDGSQFFAPAIKGVGSPTAMKSAAPPPEAIEEAVSLVTDTLQDRLKIDCPELLLLVKAPPIRLVGHQRTGKSSFARKLALIRLILLPGHTAAWCTPHLEKDNRLPVELNPIGFKPSGAKDMSAIEGLWVGIQRDIDAGRHPNQTIVWDEFGCYDTFANPDVLGQSLRSLLRESSKKEYYPILIAHGDQATFYPGVKNILTTLKQGTVKVETVGEAADDFGTMRPTGKFRIYDYGGENFKELQVPPWLTEDYLLGLLPKIPQTVEEIAQPTQVYPVEYQPTAKERLEDTFKLNSAELTQVNEVEAIPDPIDLLLLNYADDPKTASFLKWIAGKPEGEVVTREQVRCSYWAKQNGRDKESIDLVLIEAINTHLLIETDQDFYKKRDIGTSGHPKK